MNKQKTQFRLPKLFTEKWLTALRSGEYVQAKSALVLVGNETPKYCCLGVAGAICGLSDSELNMAGTLAELILKQYDEDGTENRYDSCSEEEMKRLTSLGLPKELLKDSRNGLSTTLIELNDDTGYTFPEIADWVERNVELY